MLLAMHMLRCNCCCYIPNTLVFIYLMLIVDLLYNLRLGKGSGILLSLMMEKV